MAMRWQWLDRVLGRETTLPPQQTTNPHMQALTSSTHETHLGVIDLVEASKRSSKAKGPQNLSMAWDDSYTGVPGVLYRDGLMSEKDRKDTYYKAYLNNPWVSASVDVIAKRITSGGWHVEEIEQGKGNEQHRETLKALLLYVNDDEDFSQFLRSIATDLLIYGEAFCEIVYQDGLPCQFHKIDCGTMSTRFDKHGMVTAYTQSLEKSNDTVTFEPEQIIRWWLPDPRASKKALSPIERMKDAVYLYQAMTSWGTLFFKQGGKPSFTLEMGPDSSLDDANRYIKFYKENYLGLTNAHVPNVVYAGSKVIEFGHGSVDMDFLNGRDRCRAEILAGYGVPPALVGVIESGNIGGGTGESQEKSFQYNTADPIRQVILEKFNYRLQAAFGINDWVINTKYADYRNDLDIAKIHDTKIRNGSRTPDEVRQEEGKMPYPKGGDVAVIVTTREITPVERLSEIANEQRQTAQLGMDSQKAQIEKLKQPPAPSPFPQGQQMPLKKNATQDAQLAQGDQPSIPRVKGPVGAAPLSKEFSSLLDGKTLERIFAGTSHEAAPLDGFLIHWQDGSAATQDFLSHLRKEGNETITWKNVRGACDVCALNKNQTVQVGERFPSGAYLPPEHAHCECGWIDAEGTNYTWDGVEGQYSLVKEDGEE